MASFSHRWISKRFLPSRRGQVCRLLMPHRGRFLLGFADGHQVVTVRGTFRRIEGMRWKEVPELPGYRVNDLGRVQSRVKRGRHNGLDEDWRDVQPHLRHGRRWIRVKSRREGRRTAYQVGRLVLLAFRGPSKMPDHVYVHHGNDKVADDRLANLRWSPSLQRRRLRQKKK